MATRGAEVGLPVVRAPLGSSNCRLWTPSVTTFRLWTPVVGVGSRKVDERGVESRKVRVEGHPDAQPEDKATVSASVSVLQQERQ